VTRSLALGALASALGLAATAAFAHVPLRNPANGARLHWASPTSIPIVIAAAGSDDVPSRLLLL
jgi:hypothetical protein